MYKTAKIHDPYGFTMGMVEYNMSDDEFIYLVNETIKELKKCGGLWKSEVFVDHLVNSDDRISYFVPFINVRCSVKEAEIEAKITME